MRRVLAQTWNFFQFDSFCISFQTLLSVIVIQIVLLIVFCVTTTHRVDTNLNFRATFHDSVWIHLIQRNDGVSTKHVRTPDDSCTRCLLLEIIIRELWFLNGEAQRGDQTKTVELILRDDVTIRHRVVGKTILEDSESCLWEACAVQRLCKVQIKDVVTEVWNTLQI